MQKWPSSLTFIRHGQSAYNAIDKASLPGYQEFQKLYKQEIQGISVAAIRSGAFPSKRLRELAMDLWEKLEPLTNDFDTPLTERGHWQAEETGKKLLTVISVPDIIYVSPYFRTRQTLEGILKGCPNLKDIPVLEDDRLREQEHGIRTMYCDQQVYEVLNPLQALLMSKSKRYEHSYEGGQSFLEKRQLSRSWLGTVIREHGGAPKTLKDLLVDDITRNRESVLAALLTPEALELARAFQPDTKPQNVLVVDHHLDILAHRANLERWDRARFERENHGNRPPNCSLTIYRFMERDERRHRQHNHGKMIALPEETNLVLYPSTS